MTGSYRKLTAEECRRNATGLRQGVAGLGLSLRPESSIAQMIEDAEWLADGPDDVFDAVGKFEEDPDRFLTAFMRMEQAGRIADLLEWASRVGNSRAHARYWIQQRLDRMETQDEQSQDLLFELDIAGRLARWDGLAIELAEPDIVIRYPSAETPPFAIACKRPRSADSLIRSIARAKSQIGRSGHRGLIAVSTDAIFHRSGDPTRPTIVYQARSASDAQREGKQILHDLAATISSHRDDAFDDAVGGVYLCGILTFWSGEPSAYSYTWLREPVPNDAHPHTSELLQAFDYLLFDPSHTSR